MKNLFRHSIVPILLIATILNTGAAVILSSNLTTVNVNPGDSFNVVLSLTGNSGEQITGLDYYWTLSDVVGSLQGKISLTGRDRGASPFSDPYFSNAAVTASPGNLLDPRNDSDLGASLADVLSPLSNATWLVATFQFTVDPGASVGSVGTLSTFNLSGIGWIGPDPNFPEADFDGQATLTINVVPEPSAILLLGVSAILFLGTATRRRWASAVR